MCEGGGGGGGGGGVLGFDPPPPPYFNQSTGKNIKFRPLFSDI